MNFLAHLFLSGDDEDLLIGNFIADSVRKVQWPQYSEGVIRGIELHHRIDFFTDQHALVEQSKKRLRPAQGKYSPVIVDIFYDHFLARNFSQYSAMPLPEFAEKCYALFRDRLSELPRPVQRMLPYMEAGNWLVNYAHEAGIQSVFRGMSRRASFSNNMAQAPAELFRHYEKFESEFTAFFPRLQDYCRQVKDELKAP